MAAAQKVRLGKDEIVRSAVLAAIESHAHPLTRDQLQETNHIRAVGIGRPAALRALRWLLKDGSIRCVYGPDMTPRYERVTEGLVSSDVRNEPEDLDPSRDGRIRGKRGAVLRADLMSMSIQHLELTARAHNCLRAHGIERIGDLVEKSADELLRIRHMGGSTLAVIEQALANVGMELGMRGAGDVSDLERFVGVLNHLKLHGVGTVGELVQMSVDDLLAIPNVDKEDVEVAEAGLLRWGLRIGMRAVQLPVGHSAEHNDNDQEELREETEIALENCSAFKEELVHGVTRLLRSAEQLSWLPCFLAYHGVESGNAATLQDIADKAPEYGFERAVTRERVRQVLQKAERKLREGAHRVRFTKWESSVADALGALPSPVQPFVSCFGYGSSADGDDSYEILERCADIFGLDFPFRKRDIAKVGNFVVGSDLDSEFNELEKLPKFAAGSHCEISEIARRLSVREEILSCAIEMSPSWEFLDDGRRYFWNIPVLPPRNYRITGNPILTSLCKVFSVTDRAGSSDLVQSVARDRMVRKWDRSPEISVSVLEAIAERSGLFDIYDGEIRRRKGLEWCSIGRRDLALLRVCLECGRIVPSNVLYSRLLRSGLSKENAGGVVAYSPFLIHTLTGVGYMEGVYKFVPRPEEIDLRRLSEDMAANDTAEVLDDADDADERFLELEISTRTKLSGRYFGLDAIGLDGSWVVRVGDGTEVGRISIANRGVTGLAPVISALDLGNGDLLRLRIVESERVLVAGS